jgi:RNA polymerase sigma-70 factor (sigma-E family)
MNFEEFAGARLPALLRFAAVLTGERGLAEDVVQEVLLRTHQQWRKIGALDSPEAYVRRMITNEYLSWRRRWARVIPHAAPPVAPAAVPDCAAAHAERDALRAELDKLPRQQRAVLVLRYYAGLSDSQIAELLGCTTGTVRGYASRALAALRVETASTKAKERA